jgi:alanyl-tRNA synthetase
VKALGLNEIREKYLSFFESKDHLRLKSFSLVPQNDKSLLLINSGMAPLKPYFTGKEVPPRKRITTCQKCIRTGDIENVGKTARHGTYFEMLGNFSFGDYFKEEIIPWAWEFITKELQIPEERLYITVYQDDDEAAEIWHKKIGVAADRIVRMGKEDNFWEHGLGPCGPCSEIYYDRGPEFGCGKEDCKIGCDCDRYMEFWNLVFTQFEKQEDGTYTRLTHPNIDTGMGLERMATIMQGVTSIFDVDTIKAIRDKVCEIAHVTYMTDAKKDVSIRLITDHIRSVSFMTADGVLPSNEGRGYVLRRLLRRAARHGKLLGINQAFLADLSKTVIEVSKDAYPELAEKSEYIYKLLSVEEAAFYKTIDQGTEILKDYISSLKESGGKTLSGENSFKLYDTYGFPIDLTKEILEEEGLDLDEEAFHKEMEAQRVRARSAREESTYMGAEDTVFNKLDVAMKSKFVGYSNLIVNDSKILAITKGNEIVKTAVAGDEVAVILDVTPCYAQSGGQAGDLGTIKTSTGLVEVKETIKAGGGKIAHIGVVVEGSIATADTAIVAVDEQTRMASARNHSATHLLQKSLRTVLGNHVEQAGSNVNAERLRFDFTHFQPMTEDELKQVEILVNKAIFDNLSITITETSIDEARKLGAMALFGEKYGEVVRVVNMGNYSIELCGGTHLANTAQAGSFKLVSESGVAAGVRRIEAVTGEAALNYYQQQEEQIKNISALLKTTPSNLNKKVEALLLEIKEANREIEKLKSKMAGSAIEDILGSGTVVNGVKVVVAQMDDFDANGLRNMGDQLKDKIGTGVIVLASGKDEKVSFVVMATDDAVKKGVHAGNIVKQAAAVADGSGGGRPNMAQAGAKNVNKIGEALKQAQEVIVQQVK